MPIKSVHFGAVGYVDYTVAPHAKEKKERYVKRNQAIENWNVCMSAGALSKYMLSSGN